MRDDRRDLRATPVQPRHPVIHWPLGLGVWRRLEVATVRARRRRLGCRAGVEAWVRARRAGQPARSQVGRRLDERGRRARLRPGCTRTALHGHRWGPLLAAWLATQRNRGWSAVALTAVEVDAMATPGRQQATTPGARSHRGSCVSAGEALAAGRALGRQDRHGSGAARKADVPRPGAGCPAWAYQGQSEPPGAWP